MLFFGIILVPIASCIHLLVMVSKGTPHSWRTGLLVLANCYHLDIEEWIPPMGFLPLMLWCPILLCWPFFLWCCTILVWNSDYRLYLSLLSRLRWLSRVSFVLAYFDFDPASSARSLSSSLGFLQVSNCGQLSDRVIVYLPCKTRLLVHASRWLLALFCLTSRPNSSGH